MKTIDDLLIAARSGNKNAENQLFSKLRARILNLVQYKLRNVRKHSSEVAQDVEDIVEESMLTILQKYKTEKCPYGFMAWVHKIVWYKVGNYIRIRKKKVYSDIDEDSLADDPEDSPEQIVVAKEFDELIHRALKNLKGTCREIIKALIDVRIKAYIKKRKQEGDSEGNIYCQIHRCRKRFMQLLIEEGFEV